MPGRDIVVLGASAGGVEALKVVLKSWNAGLPAAVFIVLHVPADASSDLPWVLGRKSRLPVAHAVDGSAFVRGRVYVAPPDRHLLVSGGRMRLVFSARENRHRPPENAIKACEVDHVVGIEEIGGLIHRLAGNRVPREKRCDPKPSEAERSSIMTMRKEIDRLGTPAGLTCPDCSGPVWEISDDRSIRYRCQVGHGFSVESMQDGQDDQVERAIWAAINALEERATLSRRIAARMHESGLERVADSYERRARESEAQALQIRSVLVPPKARKTPSLRRKRRT